MYIIYVMSVLCTKIARNNWEQNWLSIKHTLYCHEWLEIWSIDLWTKHIFHALNFIHIIWTFVFLNKSWCDQHRSHSPISKCSAERKTFYWWAGNFFFSLHWLAVDRQTRRKVRSERLDVCIMCPTVYSIAEKKSFNIHGDVRCLFGLHLQPVY